jgi:hypothetical protein
MNEKTGRESCPGSGPAIDLRIDTLVLHGFAPVNRQDVGRALERELVRRFSQAATTPFVAAAGTTERLDAGSVPLAATAGEDAVGTQVAQAVFEALQAVRQRG